MGRNDYAFGKASLGDSSFLLLVGKGCRYLRCGHGHYIRRKY